VHTLTYLFCQIYTVSLDVIITSLLRIIVISKVYLNSCIRKLSLFMVVLLKVAVYFVGTTGLSVSFVYSPKSRTSITI